MDRFLSNQKMFETVSQIQFYTPIVLNLFEYLNGKINPHNKCMPLIAGFNRTMYACFQYPNHMTIFLGSIIDHYGYIDDPKSYHNVMSVAALCIAHELYHAEQHIDAKKYKADNSYAEFIEDGAEYNAEIFCCNHKKDFAELFGFSYVFHKIVTKKTKIEAATKHQRIVDTVLGYFRNMKVAAEFNEVLSNNETVAILIDSESVGRDINSIIVKCDGKYTNYEDIAAFFNRIRPIWALPEMAYSTNTGDVEFNVDRGKLLAKTYYIKINQYRYDPFHI